MEQMTVKSHLVNNSVSMYLIGQANPELFKVSCVSICHSCEYGLQCVRSYNVFSIVSVVYFFISVSV